MKRRGSTQYDDSGVQREKQKLRVFPPGYQKPSRETLMMNQTVSAVMRMFTGLVR
ncbi:hypothetical protein REC12_20210 [Desulfosporosinus sp. PR]|uniref:hypothetical protein n=1 Tax=Candidatus Desulfosporosinus nitrosoreducens TaxID=3401928 RepID=UPI0027F2A12B|nr:hypothetical protein [Desulfosporosinus sp. PR]MDQ7095922.1 hypothetical protein [Desulfosporosinus sp. PR]